MKLKLFSNRIVDGSISNPEHVIAEFSEGVSKETRLQLILDHNFGLRMIHEYERYRDNMHILNVVDMLEQLEKVYGEYTTINDELKYGSGK